MARQRTNEKTGRVVQEAENKPMQTARGSWPSEGGAGGAGNGRDTAGRGLTGPYWQLVGPQGAVVAQPR